MLDTDGFEKFADVLDHEIARQTLQEFEPRVQLAAAHLKLGMPTQRRNARRLGGQ